MRRIYHHIKKRKKTALATGIFIFGSMAIFSHSFASDTVQTRYVLEAVQQGTLTTSITGTGQVQGESEVDIKPDVSGKIFQVLGKNGQEVKVGDLLAVLDSRDTQKSLRDAEMSLAKAKLAYDQFIDGADDLSIWQAQNALMKAQQTLEELEQSPTKNEIDVAQNDLKQAQRSYDQAVRDLEKTQISANQDILSASVNGYNKVAEAFTNISWWMADLADLIGTDESSYSYVPIYNLIVDSSYTEALLNNYAEAKSSYNVAWTAFQASNRESDSKTKIEVINLTLNTIQDIADAINTAQILLNHIGEEGYSKYYIADHIDDMMAIVPSRLSSVNSLVSSIESTADTIKETNTNAPYTIAKAHDVVEQAQVSLEKAQKDYNDVMDGPDELELDDARINVAEKEKALADLEAGPSELDIRSETLALETQQNKYNDFLEELSNYTVRAPISGTIAQVSARVGETAGSGGNLFTIVSKQFTAKLTLNEVDVAKVHVGDRATLSFDAIEELRMTGHVVEMDTIGTVSQGIVNYGVLVSFDTQDERVLSGMSTNITIITGVAQNTLTVSSSAVHPRGDSYYVEVLDGAQEIGGNQGVTSETPPREVPVKIGLSNDTQTEILSGITVGNFVVTRTVNDATATHASTPSSAPSLFGSGGGGRGGFSGGSFGR